ncbi:helix-turn-helix transcriptional regulator [Sphingomonas sp. LB3N6]|uniref:helix-turn-helix domain-containing protein n=1 Tax=Sphingomonas fucosidasi TaxID=3096164 RepID=UPI002FCCA949
MIVGQRILLRLKIVELSQAELARRVGMSQSAMHNLISGKSRSSTHLHKIARELQTTPAYMSGETDDPDENAPPPPPAPTVHHVMMAVALPSERALARMFEGLLRSMDLSAPVDAQALLLAKRLPIGLSQLRDLLPDAGPTAAAPAERPADLAMTVPGSRP